MYNFWLVAKKKKKSKRNVRNLQIIKYNKTIKQKIIFLWQYQLYFTKAYHFENERILINKVMKNNSYNLVEYLKQNSK